MNTKSMKHSLREDLNETREALYQDARLLRLALTGAQAEPGPVIARAAPPQGRISSAPPLDIFSIR